MKNTKKIIFTIMSAAMVFLLNGQAAFADTNSTTQTVNTTQATDESQADSYLTVSEKDYKFKSDGPNGSHEQFANQALKILKNDKGSKVADFYSQYKNVLLTYCDKPDSDEKDYVFAYHFYNPYTNKNYLPSFMSTSKITGMTKFHEHMTNAVNSYKSNKEYAMQELGRAIHFLEDVNVPHHASNNVAGLSSHSQYESYVDKNNSSFFVNTSKAYNKYSNLSFYDYCTSIFNDCAKNAYSYKSICSSFKTADFETAAKPTIKFAQENIASLLYRYEKEVSK